MAYQFDCMVDGCDHTMRGDTEDEVVEQAREHAQNHHPDMDFDEQQVRNNTQQV